MISDILSLFLNKKIANKFTYWELIATGDQTKMRNKLA